MAYRKPWLYPWLRVVARVAAAAFIRRLRARHIERLPAEGPLILVANHPNMLLDAFGLGLTSPRPLHFLAKSPLFANPINSFLLRGCGGLPVYRKMEGSTDNRGTFDACFEVLAQGGAIALFPEGTSHNELRMLEFKTGAARIALGAATRCGRAVKIQPVGLWYSDKTRWWSDLLAVYGEPIEVPVSEAGEQDREAVRALTDTAERAIRELIVELDDHEQGRRLALVEGLFRHLREGQDPTTPGARYAFARTALSHYRAWEERDPGRIAALIADLDDYGELLEQLGLGPSHAAWHPGRVRALLQLLMLGLLLLMLAPPALVGLLLNLPPFLLTRALARRVKDEEEVATVKLLVALIAYPLWYAAIVAVAWQRVGPLALLGLLSPLVGLLTKAFVNRLRRMTTGVRLYFGAALSADHRALADAQERLLVRVEALRDELADAPGN